MHLKKIKKVIPTWSLKTSLIFFLVSFFVYSSDDIIFCFDPNISLDSVERHMSLVLKPGDNLTKDRKNNCFSISLSKGRQTLFKSFLARKYPMYRTYGGHETEMSQIGNECKLVLEEVYTVNENAKNLKLTKEQIALKNQTGGEVGKRSMLLTLSSGRQGRMRAYETDLAVTCKKKQSTYQLEVSLWGQDAGVSTTLDLVPGQKREIASVVQTLKNKNKSKGIQTKNFNNTGIENSKTNSVLNKSYYLLIE